MQISALGVSLFMAGGLLGFTVYSLYVGFGPPSGVLRDPFDEHED